MVIDEAIRGNPKAILKRFNPEDHLNGLAPEERLKGLAPEDRLKGLDPATIEAWLTKERSGHYPKKT
ncbi:hypothetical protein [Thiorhodovibrio winogradskyi]|uniref:hypothetical protein n=1 Tax=Thiorhodovibrio winogradskyi TaxID=77007 RepID=UPI002E2D14D9|nr:hypothetical protein [Thiorhodovibrio winogradskyi]